MLTGSKGNWIKNIAILLVCIFIIVLCFHENSRLALKYLLKEMIRAIT
jgi:hypothetical protein